MYEESRRKSHGHRRASSQSARGADGFGNRRRWRVGGSCGRLRGWFGAEAASASTLEGTWQVDVTLGDGTKHQALILCTKDGGVGVSATLASDSFANGFGVWTRSGSQYLITFEALVVTSGTFGGSLRIRAMPTIGQSGDQLTAQVQFDVQLPGASSFSAGGGATLDREPYQTTGALIHEEEF
jgi:hypothetical protein